MSLPKSLEFLKALQQNNNREWFHANRPQYDDSRKEFEDFCQKLLHKLTEIQQDLQNTRVKDCLLRINRDIRFSNDKSPYKRYFGAGICPGGKNSGKVDFYLQIQPHGESFIGGGMWEPTSSQLADFRQEIDYNPNALKSIIYSEKFKNYFNQIWGEKLKKMPKGYSEDHPDIELLKYKQMFFYRKFSDKEVQSENFISLVFEGCQILKPYLDYTNNLFFPQ